MTSAGLPLLTRNGSRGSPNVTLYTRGFSYFVTSMTAPVASGWSDGRVGLAPTGKRRLTTAHTRRRHLDAPTFLNEKCSLSRALKVLPRLLTAFPLPKRIVVQ